LQNDLSKIYEPRAPAPTQRLAALRTARDAGLNVYVAMAPTYPECDEEDLRATLRAVAEVAPVTIFHEPINIRAENVERIVAQARSLGIRLKTEVFSTREQWENYAVHSLQTVDRLAEELGLSNKLHLWPDKSLGNSSIANRMTKPREYLQWLMKYWGRISEWPQIGRP
jgi:DNA repair photolyase